jgi:cytochrome b pre-mRNA-processing protein 3
MLALLKKIFYPAPDDVAAKNHYVALAEQSRQAFLYEQCALPDTLDGRFESIILHLFIAERRLPNNTDSMNQIRNLHEAFLEDMDRSLREGGVGDTSIGKRVKRMAAGLYGRLQAYRDTIDDADQFREALLRNAYGTCDSPPTMEAVGALANYIHAQIAAK